ncbi:histidine phosphatase family protein [Spirosoma sp. BT702]|uniref:Histidine phosphatase family protein n=1 Tax=Spirosoma profusum TaxID=2771354 RepID=A0A927AQ84_9BACT|nr:phosphoglycerate mutase family protein [Spirosoma profusum]MBD2699883.1 histidine phosphatase family protein [Spirosoma profusum]
MRVIYFLFCLMTSLLTACSTTTVFIVRHAEKVSEADTTDLTPAGHERAQALVDVLASKGVDSIFTTPYRRTRQTAAPLARQLGLTMVDYPARPNEAIVKRINLIRSKMVLVVGHSNTILDIAKGLGTQPSMTTIASGDFDNLLRVQIKRGLFGTSRTISQTTYGQPTPP